MKTKPQLSFSFVLPLVLGPLALGLAACGDEPSDEEYDDIASMVGALAADGDGSATEMADHAAELAEDDVPPVLQPEGEGRFVGRRGAFEYAYRVTCFDGSGAPLTDCAGASSARVEVDTSGEVQTARREGSFDRSADWTLADLGTPTIVLNGSGRTQATGSFRALLRPVSRSYIVDTESTYTDVLVRAEDHRLVGGTIRWIVEADRTETRRSREIEASLDVDAELVIIGPGEGRLTLDGSRSYIVRLDDGTVAPE